VVVVLVVALAWLLLSTDAHAAKDDRGEVETVGSCSRGATATLKLKARDGGIELELEVEHTRAGSGWRVAIVHERRVAWKGAVRTSRPGGTFELRRSLPDLPGVDTVTARAWGPNGVTCRATATLLPGG